jgi:NAD(P)H-flavin reductase
MAMELAVGKMDFNYSKALTAPDPWLPVPATVVGLRRETYDTTTYVLTLDNPATRQAYCFRPGQFNMVGFPGIGEAPISLSSDPGLSNTFEHTVRTLGDVTGAMARLCVGDKVALRGPFGSSWPMDEAKNSDLLVVAGGIGLAPLRPVIEQAVHQRSQYGRLTILYGAKTPGDLVFGADFERWSAQSDTQLLLTVDRAEPQSWPHHVGVVPVLFEAVSLAPQRTIAMVCGPEVMMRFVVVDLLKRGFPPEHVFLSMERRMRCGIAQCGHCFLGPKFVCQDGPVFRYTQLYGLFGKGV